MKKIVLLQFAVLCTIIGFAQKDKAMANNRSIYKAIETGDVSTLKNYIAKDAVDHGGGANGQDITNGDSIISMLGNIHNSFTNLKVDVIADAINGDYVFTLVHMTGNTNANPGMGMPPNKAIDSKSVDVVRLKDGKAVEHWGFEDPKEMMQMMGK